MRPCSGRTWSDNTRWVVFSSKIEEPRARWSLGMGRTGARAQSLGGCGLSVAEAADVEAYRHRVVR